MKREKYLNTGSLYLPVYLYMSACMSCAVWLLTIWLRGHGESLTH